MSNPVQNVHDTLSRVAVVEQAGATIPPKFAQLRDRWTAVLEMDGSTAAEQLAAAVLTGKGGDVETLYPLALAGMSANPQAAAQVRETIARQIGPELHRLYGTTAAKNHAHMAREFNAAAAEFAALVAVVDPDADPAQLLTAPDEVRHRWSDAPGLAARLDGLAEVVRVAAQLAGFAHAATDEGRLPLVVDPGGAKRRDVWDAWSAADGRGGRWSRLIAAGATLTARPLDDVSSYRKPMPMESRFVKTRIGHARQLVDPEESATD